MAKDSKVPSTFLPLLKSAEQGITDAWPANTPSMTVLNKTYTQAEALSKVEGYVAVFGAPEALAKQHADAVATREESYDDAHKWMNAFFSVLTGILGPSAASLSAYGKAPPKQRTPQTTAQKARSAELRNATRKLRGTMGKKQKSHIHGTLPADPTPAPAPVEPVPSPAKTGG